MRTRLLACALVLLVGCGSPATPGVGALCSHASDCPGAVCIAGTCTPATTCTTSRACSGLVCDVDTSTCVECVTTLDCPGGSMCSADVCIATVSCDSDRDCSFRTEVCDTVDGVCVECNLDVDCDAADRCDAHACVPRPEMDAGTDLDAAGGDDAAILDGAVDAGIDAGLDAEQDGAIDAGMFSSCSVEGWYFADVDGDGSGDPDDVVRSCTVVVGRVVSPGDCDDHDPTRHRGATEACDGSLDDDCDGSVDEGCACPAGTNRPCGVGVGACASSMQQCEYPSVLWGRCYSPTPVPESCNGIDDDCDGSVDEGGDAACGAGATCSASGTCSSVHPVHVVTRDRTSYAIMSDGTLYVWGNGTPVASQVATDMGASSVRSLAAVDGLVCFATVDEHVWCWSDCGLAPPRAGGGVGCSGPVRFNDFGVFPAFDLSLGPLSGCLVADDGSVGCWGDGSRAELGLGSSGYEASPIPVTGLGHVRDLAQDIYATCAVETSGAVRCWGRNDVGTLGGGTIGGTSAALVDVPITDAVAIAAGRSHVCAQRASGDVMCWGTDDWGELGDGAPATRSATPVRVEGIPSGSILATELASSSTCVITPSGGQVMCVGYGDPGSLGDGLATTSTTPVTVTGLSGVRQLSGRGEHWCAVTATEVWCWGSGISGEVGTGHLVPGRVTGLP